MDGDESLTDGLTDGREDALVWEWVSGRTESVCPDTGTVFTGNLTFGIVVPRTMTNIRFPVKTQVIYFQ